MASQAGNSEPKVVEARLCAYGSALVELFNVKQCNRYIFRFSILVILPELSMVTVIMGSGKTGLRSMLSDMGLVEFHARRFSVRHEYLLCDSSDASDASCSIMTP